MPCSTFPLGSYSLQKVYCIKVHKYKLFRVYMPFPSQITCKANQSSWEKEIMLCLRLQNHLLFSLVQC